MKLRLHPSWVVMFLSMVVIAVDVGLVLFGVVKNETPEAEVIFEGAKEWFGERVSGAIDTDVAGLGMGYLLGSKDSLPSGLKDKIQVVGLSHIIVVSGTHLAIIVDWSRKLFGRLSRNAGVFFAILLLLIYIGIIGLTPSLFRSGLVSILTLLAWRTGRKFESWRILVIVAAITLVFDPTYILNVSWQLSMAAYAGILLITPILLEFFYSKREKPGMIGSTIIASLAATIACLPISFYYFGSVSLLSFVANILILPTIPLAMGLTLVAGIFGGVMGWLAGWILKYHVAVVNFLGQYDSLLVQLPKNNALIFLWYVPVTMVIVWWNVKRCKKRRDRVKQMQLRLREKAECLDTPLRCRQPESSP